jgi:hypothetical protein
VSPGRTGRVGASGGRLGLVISVVRGHAQPLHVAGDFFIIMVTKGNELGSGLTYQQGLFARREKVVIHTRWLSVIISGETWTRAKSPHAYKHSHQRI